MPKEIEHCHECGAKKVIYRHRLNKGLVTGLRALYDDGGVAKLSALNLTVSQHNNFQKLQYWDLIEKYGKSRWKITAFGLRFICKGDRVPNSKTTYRGKPSRRVSEGVSWVRASDLIPGYQKPEDYIRESSNLTRSGQLFPEMA